MSFMIIARHFWASRYGNEKVAQALREMGMRCGLRCDGGRKSGMMDTGYFVGQNSGMTFKKERDDGVFFACVKVLFMILY